MRLGRSGQDHHLGRPGAPGRAAWGGVRAWSRSIRRGVSPTPSVSTSLGNTAHQVDGPWPGELWALQLDPKSTFDDLVRKHADSPEQAEGIFQNRIYRNLTEALSGTQEYMAMEKLYELAEEDRFDLIVVDTPPSRNALDFLEAPSRLTRFLGNRLFQFLLLPTRASLRAFTMASQALLKTISKVAGAEIVNDAVAFFQAFAGMEEGFRLRAGHVRQLLADRSTAFVLVAAPRARHRRGGRLVRRPARRRRTAGRRTDRQPGAPGVLAERRHLAGPDAGRASWSGSFGDLVENLRELCETNEGEEATISELVRQVSPAPVVRVPLLDADVHDLEGLEKVADALFGDQLE